jgi:uncharacterized protein
VIPFDKSSKPMIGVAYSSYVPKLLSQFPAAVDYVEIPFELLLHDSSVLDAVSPTQVVLHCASMSLAGYVRPAQVIVDRVDEFIKRTNTPWLGEHLSYIAADRLPLRADALTGDPYNVGYTVAPPMNDEMITTVAENISECRRAFHVPILIENPPLYFTPPGSTMAQPDFIREICRRTGSGLLLDLAHLYITSRLADTSAEKNLKRLPLDAIVEVHISGVDEESGGLWDSHASRAPAEVLDLLAIVLCEARVRAITLEYNWSSQFPLRALLEELERTRAVMNNSTAVSGGSPS